MPIIINQYGIKAVVSEERANEMVEAKEATILDEEKTNEELQKLAEPAKKVVRKKLKDLPSQ